MNDIYVRKFRYVNQQLLAVRLREANVNIANLLLAAR